jgi:hypothetical protein
VGVDEPAAVRRQEVAADQLHEAGRDDQVRLVAGHRRGQGPVPRGPVREVLDPVHERRQPGPLRTGQALDAVAVGADGNDLRAVRRVGGCVEQGLEVGAGPRDEDNKARGSGLGGGDRHGW